MTIIAAAVGPDGTFIGSDGQVQCDQLITSTNQFKWNVSPCGEWAFGGAGLVTFDQVLLCDGAIWQSWDEVRSGDHLSIKTTIANRMRKILHAVDGFEIVRDDGDIFGDYRWSPLVATKGHVWKLLSDLRTFREPIEGFYQACGIAEDFAIGAMSALKASGEDSAEVLVRSAVEVSCRMTTNCGGEIFVWRLGTARRWGVEDFEDQRT